MMPRGEEKPIAFASRATSKAQRNNVQIEWEALGNIFGESTSFISTVQTKIDTSDFFLSCLSQPIRQLLWLPAEGKIASLILCRRAMNGLLGYLCHARGFCSCDGVVAVLRSSAGVHSKV